MALTAEQKAKMRSKYYKVRGSSILPYTKPDLNAVVTALDDRYQADKASWSTDMETAAPGVFDSVEKKRIAAAYFWLRFVEDLI